MIPFQADLHLHSTHSDGLYTPAELMDLVADSGVTMMALTDHDTTSGTRESIRLGLESQIEVIPGVEISVGYEPPGDALREVHILAYYFDLRDDVLQQLLLNNRRSRIDRNRSIISRLRLLDVHIDPEPFSHESQTLGRPHIAREMMRAGLVQNENEAFLKYLGTGKPFHIPRQLPPAEEVIRIIHKAGGVAVMAHPVKNIAAVEQLLPLVEMGLDGLEILHPSHSAGIRQMYRQFCDEHHLLTSGGSDFHGRGRYLVPGFPVQDAYSLRHSCGKTA